MVSVIITLVDSVTGERGRNVFINSIDRLIIYKDKYQVQNREILWTDSEKGRAILIVFTVV